MSNYTLYNDTLPDIKKYSYTYISADELKELDDGAALAPSKLRLPSYTMPTGIIDAVDIDWKGIKVGDVEVESSGHLAYLISNKASIDPGSIQVDSVGIPIFDKDMIDEMGDNLPDKYISVPNPEEIADDISTKMYYQQSGNGLYLDILFSSIRKLQAEVTKLKNSFNYGIYSMNGRDTAMSHVMSEYSEDMVNEPLWATEESDLSELDCGLYLTGNDNGLNAISGEVILDGLETLKITGSAIWEDSNIEYEPMKSCIDAKEYIFMTVSSLNVQITIKQLESNEYITIDLSRLNAPITASEKYNVMFILSRSSVDKEGNPNPNTYNFVWISIADYLTGVSTVEGYWIYNPVGYNDRTSSSLQTLGDETDRYYIHSVVFNNLTLYKYNTYSKLQDFSNTVVPSTAASDESYKYSAAHITIRSVESLDILEEIKDQLKKNELIYIENLNSLYIKTDSGVKAISGSDGTNTDTDTGMEKQEIIEWLSRNGIIVTDEGGNLKLNDVSDITFIHEESGKKFMYKTDAEGNLRSTELSDETLQQRVDDSIIILSDDNNINIRGFAGTLGVSESGIRNAAETNKLNVTSDVGLFSDRIKIGAIYMPNPNQLAFGCSHAYVELENTSNKDFQLDGCYLHLAQNTNADGENGTDNITVHHLALSGKIPAGGTYLIRGKQYCDVNESNVFIKVNTYDIEWWENGELLDFTRQAQNTFMLTYGYANVEPTRSMFGEIIIKSVKYVSYNPHFIDSISIGAKIHTGKDTSGWDQFASTFSSPNYDAIFKNVYELDPAKQAFQSLMSEKKDSSRTRGQNATDFQTLDLRDEYIEFPFSDERIHMSIYTPKASFEGKNVSTDKSKLDTNKPNMVSCSFGIDIYNTRCFNWVSTGIFDEFIWVRQRGTDKWYRFESYKNGSEKDKTITTDFDNIQKVQFEDDIKIPVYNRLINTLPASEIVYSVHKVILNINRTEELSEPVTYEYIVGRADKNGNPNEEHTSDVQTFTLYPHSYRMRIYHHTDQQGFQWIEYQAWTGAAKKMLEVIEYDLEHENIIPVLINTGDMTQNGTRINEWLDFYNGGKCLFERFEQLAVVGNNDLCDTNINILGTGDDSGKSNGYYFHVAFCFEIDPDTPFVINGKYAPSTYYVKDDTNAIVLINSEFTTINCEKWFGLRYDNHPVNIYTGYTMATKEDTAYTPVYAVGENKLNFEPIYNQLWKIFNKLINVEGYDPANVICGCHEMPFTVITNANLKSTDTALKGDRSLNGTSLVGSHMNRMSSYDTAAMYWFSRLLEYFRIKLMIGGHKHTYICTNVIRENYEYLKDGEWVSSTEAGPMEMPQSLDPEVYTDAKWSPREFDNNGTTITINTTKFPIMEYSQKFTITSDTFYPIYGMSHEDFKFDEYGGIIYFMLQATAAKLKSNKELPSQSQKFGYIIPKTNHKADGSDGPYAEQQYPMFAKVDLKDRYIVLCRVANVLDDASHTITQQKHGNGNITIGVAHHLDSSIYGEWVNNTSIESLNSSNALISF